MSMGASYTYPSTFVNGLRIMRFVALKALPVIRQRGVCCGLPDVDAGWAEGRLNS